jgi:signal transduction histidine kinase/phage shock protein PspC (stress-responsive transcriptional regulator)
VKVSSRGEPTTQPNSGRSPKSATARPVLFTRSASDRVVAGVAGGIGSKFGIDSFVVRIAFVVLCLAGGTGVLAYLVLWALSGDPKAEDSPQTAPRQDSMRQVVAVSFIVLGALLILRRVGLWFGDAFVWPVALAALGSAVIWTRSEDSDRRRARWSWMAARMPARASILVGPVSPGRIAVGAVFVAAGMATFLAANDALGAARNLILAVVVTATGVALILGPWMWRLARETVEERRERIRSEERAEMAAHLHDSVLQTLALIQRSDSPKAMASLARLQERELRAWLYGPERPPGESLTAAIEEMAARIEQLHQVPVDVVVVGDCELDDRAMALVQASSEAVLNAAKHSEASVVSVYVEVEDGLISAYVRDQGRGFELDGVPADRRGIADSIVGRIQRVGGTGTIKTAPGEGTEVGFRLPRESE